MADGRPAPMIDTEDWLALVRHLLASDVASSIGTAERTSLLDLARVAAHTSERVAAPLSTYLAGLALATVPAGERADRIAALVRQLEEETASA